MDISNKGLVGAIGKDVAVMIHRSRMTPDDAMNFAAWLVVMAQSQDDTLPPVEEYIAAVEKT